MEPTGYIILLLTCFSAAIIGTMMGMAMLIIPPVMVFLGVPIHGAIATARFSALGIGMGNLATFAKQGTMRKEYILPFAIAGMIGAISGAFFLEKISERTLYILLGTFMILISIIVFFDEKIKRFKPLAHEISLKHHAMSVVAGFILGAYIGVIGGGAATIIIFLLVLIYGLNFHAALANQKAITFPITITAAIVFISQGLIDYKLGIPMMLANIAGGMVGARLVLKMKGRWLKNILVPVTIALGIKLIFF
jgi:uncharacterized protein